jgi:anti-sigma factor RsiW
MGVCRDVIMNLLFDWLDGHLVPEVAAECEDHVRICPACRAYVATYRKTRQLAATAARPAVPQDLKPRLQRFLLKRLADLPDP